MPVPKIEALRFENWTKLTQVNDRLQALQDIENGLAAQEKRDPCEVKFFPEDKIKSGLMGEYVDQDKSIYINPELVVSNEPYAATETAFHESRHAYQAHIARHPEQAENQEQAKDWQMTEQGGYLTYQKYGYNKYRWQPEEKDANQVAHQSTDELYGQEFGDTQGYPKYRAEQEQQINDDIFRAQQQYGQDYEKVARDEMVALYQKGQEQTQQAQVSQQESELSNIELPQPTGESASSVPPDQEEQDYSYGYGH